MAIDQTSLALNLCTQLQAGAESIMKGLEIIVRAGTQADSAGVALTSPEVDEALANSALKHASGADFQAVITAGGATRTWMEANFMDDAFQKVRSGGM